MKFDLKAIDYKRIEKLFSAQSSRDLNEFLENLPQKAGHTVLIAAGIAWAMAAAIGLYTTLETQKLTTLRAELKNTEALKPAVPKIKKTAVDKSEVERFAKESQKIYRGLSISSKGNKIIITAQTTDRFIEFREALGHVQNGGNGWRVTLESLCVGRECDRRTALAASLSIDKVSVDKGS